MKTQWSIGVVLVPGFELLDVFGPLEMFGAAPNNFDLHMVAEKAGIVASGQGPESVAELGFAEYTMSVCTGSALLAKAGILDGFRATTNKKAFERATAQSELPPISPIFLSLLESHYSDKYQ